MAMTVFEFILVSVSIIIGLGIAELLRGVVRVLRGQFAPRALHSLWITVLFFQQLQWLWSRWDASWKTEWAFAEFGLFLLPSIILLLSAALLFPETGSEEDLTEYLLRRRRQFFGLLAVLMVTFSLENWFVLDNGLWTGGDAARLVQFLNLAVLANTERVWIHWTLGSLVLVIMVAFAFVITPQVS